MKRISIAIAGCCLLVTPALGDEAAPNPVIEALTGGTPYIDARYRFEHVEQDGFAKNADASTLRLRFGYVTGKAYDFSARIEVEHIDPIGNDNFNSTTNGESTRPTVADPGETEINQLYLRYQGVPDTTLTVGRQRVILDNARFVGNVGFRQNEQTFDTVVIANTSLPATTLIYGYVWNVNRIFGDASPSGDFRTNTQLINASYGGFDFIKPTAYAYLIDLTDPDKENASTASFGLRLKGATPLAGDWKALYTAEYAHQTDFAESNVGNNHNYYTVELGVAATGIASRFDVTGKIGWEVLDGDGIRAFQTPLATLHAFNGWTDRFLSTPVNGIQDFYGSLGIKAYGVSLLGLYHDFRAEQGGLNHGTEWGVRIARTFFDHLTLAAKYANYSAEDTSVDTEKLWLTVQVKF